MLSFPQALDLWSLQGPNWSLLSCCADINAVIFACNCSILSYLQDTHPSQLARFFSHSIIVQLVEAKGTVWSADTFFRKTEKVSISSEIHHELLGKKKKKGIEKKI